jgi:exonuclease SbcC
MRIESVRIRNLASLAGTQPALHFGPGGLSAGLVAITGPTGAGKSTILDAICLALFGETPRLSGNGEDRNPRNILTRGATDGHAEVDFVDARGRHLTSRWEITRARSGALQQPKMTLSDRDSGEALARGKRETCEQVQQAVNLDRDQFIGVALLAQGSFSTFIAGKGEDRGELLERLTGAEIYSRLGRASFRWFRQCNQALEGMKARMDEHVPLDPEARVDLQYKRDVSAQELEILDIQWTAAGIRLDLLTRLQTALNDLAAAQAEFKLSQQAKKASGVARAELDDAERAESLRSPLDQATSGRAQEQDARLGVQDALKNQVAAQDAYQDALAVARAELAGVLGCQRNIAASRDVESRFAAAKPESLQILRGALKRLQDLFFEVRDIENRLREARAVHDGAVGDEFQKRRVLGERETELGKAQAAFETAERALRLDIDAYGALDRRLDISRRLDDLGHLLEEWENETANSLIITANLKALSIEVQDLNVRHEEAMRQYQISQQTLIAVEEAWNRAIRAASFGEHRHELHIGEECPLCLQNIRTLPPAFEAGALKPAESELNQTKHVVQVAAAERETLNIDLNLKKSNCAVHEAARVKSITSLAKFVTQYGEINSILTGLPEEIVNCGFDAVGTRKLEAALAIQRLKDLETIVRDARTFRDETRGTRDTALAAVGVAERFAATSQTKREEFDQQKQNTARKLEITRQECRTSFAQLATAVGDQTPAEADSELWLDTCATRYARWKSLDEVTREISPLLDSLEANLTRSLPPGTGLELPEPREVLDAADLRKACVRTQLASKYAEEKYVALLMAETRTESAGATCEKAEEARTQAEARLAEQLEIFGIADEAAARMRLRSPDDIARIRRDLLAIGTRFNSAETALQIRQQSTTEAEQAFGKQPVPARDAVATSIAEESGRLGVTDHARIAARNIFQDYDRRLIADEDSLLRLNAIAAENEELKREAQRVARLCGLIGDSQGKKFRDFAQQITLDALVYLANQRLDQFAPRYALYRRVGLELEVIDRDLADERRPVTTLSGGESFLVSLALAIALSDLNRGRKNIGSIFIDEGFGSLDQSYLELALAALETVQHQLGAQLFVISHVGELQSRWQDKVEVRRTSRGRSWLVVPGGPTSPPRTENRALINNDLGFDMDAIFGFVLTSPGLTRGKIADALGLVNSVHFSKALQADSRIVLEGKRYFPQQNSDQNDCAEPIQR